MFVVKLAHRQYGVDALAFRQRQQTPTAQAEPLSPETPDGLATPCEQAITADESALMWSILTGIPEIYREPMVLYYREQHSVAAVAATLEVSEDTVRQRLVRGRAMLNERIAKRVETALERSAPTTAFAGMVVLALPLHLSPAVVAGALTGGGTATTPGAMTGTLGAATAKSGFAIKAVALLAALPAIVTGLTDFLRFRAQYESSTTADRRGVIRRHVMPLLINAAIMLVVVAAVFRAPFLQGHPIGFGFLVAAVVATSAVLIARYQNKVREQAGSANPNAVTGFEYRSRGEWLGIPWIHVRAGGASRWQVTHAWIAISDGVAIGGLFAGGPIAAAPFSVGNMAVGLLSLGGIVAGVGGLGGVAVGWWAAGGLAAGWMAAWGGVAVAYHFAAGGLAFAMEANNAAANAYFAGQWFFGFVANAWKVALWTSFLAWLPALLLIGWHVRPSRKA